MNYLGGVLGKFKALYSGINGATLTGAIDVVVVEQEDGTFKCSPFHVRFGKLGVLRSREKVVDIELNGAVAPIRMKLGDSGEAFFVQEAYDFDLDDENLATSPLPASPQFSDSDNSGSRRQRGETEESEMTDDNKDDDDHNPNGNNKMVILNLDSNNGDADNDNDDDDILLDEDESPSESSKTETVIQMGAGGNDSKNRKRRRKRKRNNQGSKSNIIIMDPTTSTSTYPPQDGHKEQQDVNGTVEEESQEGIFTMDEELNDGINLVMSNNNHSHGNGRNYHRDFYSDTEVDVMTTTLTPNNSRPSSPIQSDSEYEINKVQKENSEVQEVGKWPWGELPSTGINVQANAIPSSTESTTIPIEPTSSHHQQMIANPTDKQLSSSYDERMSASRRAENKSMLGSMFSFMTKRHGSGNGTSSGGPPTTDSLASTDGIYLDDLFGKSMDPEVAALYFPNFGRDTKSDSPKRDQDEDVESGKGSSIAQSPAPGSSPKTSHISIYMDEQRRQQQQQQIDEIPPVVVKPATPPIPKFEAISICGSNLALFEQSQLTFDELAENPEMILNAPPDSIVVKLDGKLVPWSAALPQLLSTTFFKRPLPSQLHERLIGQYSAPISRSNSVSSGTARRGYSWFPWRRSTSTTTGDSKDLEQPMLSTSFPVKAKDNIMINSSDTNPLMGGRGEEGVAISSSVSERVTMPTSHLLRKESSTSSSDESEGGGSTGPRSHKPSPLTNMGHTGGSEKYKKSLRLTSDQITKLGLRYGQNEALFSVTTAYQGTTVARCHIYLWRYDDRVVVSDIDGTITKSDVLGHILPIIGQDWAQSGVAQLFTQIQDNGYKMLYLSARAIGQAATTRDYLRSIKQDDVTLPDGPLLLNPTSLMSAFHREVIEKKPEEFKIACLRDIETLFPTNPFYAGYGNKINDVWAYRALSIAIPRIFTINHKGELRHALTNTFQSSYTSLVELAEFIFPAYKVVQPLIITEEEKVKTTHLFSTTDGFSSFEFWRDPVPDLLTSSDSLSSPSSSSWPTTAAAVVTAS